MKKELNILKGIHPGFVLERELKKRKLRKNSFAFSLNEHAQTINAITKGRRAMNTPLSLKIEKELGLEEGYFMILQTYYDIEIEKKKANLHPDLAILRPVLFWDTKIESINWEKQKRAVIQRVWERGNEIEKLEITRFYGTPTIEKTINKIKENATL
jgi:addiction module HigA family antidote